MPSTEAFGDVRGSRPRRAAEVMAQIAILHEGLHVSQWNDDVAQVARQLVRVEIFESMHTHAVTVCTHSAIARRRARTCTVHPCTVDRRARTLHRAPRTDEHAPC